MLEEFKMIESRNFTCPDMEGYSFSYPVFEELKDILEDSKGLKIKDSEGNIAIEVEVAAKPIMVSYRKTNPGGVPFQRRVKDDELSFMIENKGNFWDLVVRVSITSEEHADKYKIIREQYISTISNTLRILK